MLHSHIRLNTAKMLPDGKTGDVGNLRQSSALSDTVQHVTAKYVIAYCFCTLVLDLHVTYKLTHIYDHVTKLCKQKADVVQNHENTDVQNKQ